MKIKKLLIGFATYFVAVLAVTSVVTYLWNAIFREAGAVDWETSFQLAIIFGIVLPWVTDKE